MTLAFCSQEETGGTGAKTAAFRVNPTHALAVDVSFAYTPDAPRDECGDLGAGAMIGIAPILDNASFPANMKFPISWRFWAPAPARTRIPSPPAAAA